MATIVGIPWYRQEDWPALMRLFEDAHILHDSFDAWRENVGEIEAELKRHGHIVERIHLDPEKFAAWCRERGLKTDAGARSRYASEVARARHLLDR